MDWMRAIDGYCERTGPGLWAEPLNAATNLGFLLAAALCWRMTAGDRGARALVLILAAIGVGSALFHTYAQVWAMLADVLPIQAFILVYLYLATVRFLGAPRLAGLAVAAGFVPAATLVAGAIGRVAGPLNGSTGYLPVLLAIGLLALATAGRAPATARRLAVGAGLLAVSLTFRTIDAAACPRFPAGTHFAWHLANAVLLGWMIRALVLHGGGRLARRDGAG